MGLDGTHWVKMDGVGLKVRKIQGLCFPHGLSVGTGGTDALRPTHWFWEGDPDRPPDSKSTVKFSASPCKFPRAQGQRTTSLRQFGVLCGVLI